MAFETGPGPRFEPLLGSAGSSAFHDCPVDQGPESATSDPAQAIRDEYEARLAEQAAAHAAELALVELRNEARIDRWADEWDSLRRRDAVRLADEATVLAVAIAEKIIRDRVDMDRGVLVRNLETALFKIQSDRPVTVLVNPHDQGWLAEDTALRERLRIGAVVPDRRVEVGGCRLRTDDGEWDATLKQQLESLADLVEGALRAEEATEAPGE